MPYPIKFYRFGDLKSKDKGKVLTMARIEARRERYICYVDVMVQRVLNLKEADEQKKDSIEYFLDSRIQVTPKGIVTEL